MARRVNVSGKDKPPSGESAPRATRQPGSGAPSGATGGGPGTSAPTQPPVAKLTPDERKLHAALVRTYGMVGVGIHAVASSRKDPNLIAAGVNVTSQAEAAADAWVELARQNPRVKRALQGFVQGSAVANLAGAHLAMVLPLLAAQNMVPGNIGAMFLSPEATAAGMEAAAANAAAQNGHMQ